MKFSKQNEVRPRKGDNKILDDLQACTHTHIHSHPTAWISTVAEAQTNLMLTFVDSGSHE